MDPKVSYEFASIADFHARMNAGWVRFEGRCYQAICDPVDYHIRLMRLRKYHDATLHIDDPRLHIRGMTLGYFVYDGTLIYAYRRPERVYRSGLSSANIRGIVHRSGLGLNLGDYFNDPGFVAMLEKEYPPVNNVLSGKHTQAVSQDFALVKTPDGWDLFFQAQPDRVGYWSKDHNGIIFEAGDNSSILERAFNKLMR